MSFYAVLVVPGSEHLEVAMVNVVVVVMDMAEMVAEEMVAEREEEEEPLCHVRPCLRQSELVKYGM